MRSLYYLLFALVLSSCQETDTSVAEPQISFAKEVRPHAYYVEQAELWWEEVQRDTTSEMAWYQYYRACRNAQGTADWKEDFVHESPALRLGRDIVPLMERAIPNSFIYFFVSGSTGGVDANENLLKAYELNPDFTPIHGPMVTYAVGTHDGDLRKVVNANWYAADEMNPGLLAYAEDVLASVEPHGILLTQHDNDSYPAWMLQDVKGYRSDVWVINIDFLLMESYRDVVFDSLGIPPLTLNEIDVDEYRENWANIVQHLLANPPKGRPVHIAMTVSDEWYSGFEDRLSAVGLTHLLNGSEDHVRLRNAELWEKQFEWSRMTMEYPTYSNEANRKLIFQNYQIPLQWKLEHAEENAEYAKTLELLKH
ncbi:MAG: hypothetical protein EP346_13870 [Bacteroidetes bacterium]|nr:MAG: hypothetical protein EP346_13870 [Bacteroidota bacterium]